MTRDLRCLTCPCSRYLSQELQNISHWRFLFLKSSESEKKIPVKGYKTLKDCGVCTLWQKLKTGMSKSVWAWHVHRDDTLLAYSFLGDIFLLIFISGSLKWLWLFKMKYWSNPRVTIRKNKLSSLRQGTWRKALLHHVFSYSELFIKQCKISRLWYFFWGASYKEVLGEGGVLFCFFFPPWQGKSGPIAKRY